MHVSQKSRAFIRPGILLSLSFLVSLIWCEAAGAQTSLAAAPDESFILFQDDGGATVCREATEAERARLRGADGTHVIYRGAPLRRAGGRLVANAPADSTGLQLLPSAGLTIVLQGTEQLEANPAAKNAFIVAANRWESLISTQVTVTLSVDYGPTFFGTPYPDSRILGQTGAATGLATLSTARKRLLASSNPTPSEEQLYTALPTSSVPAEFDGRIVQVSTIRLTTALARAIGFSTGEGPDALIGFNSNFGDGGQFDFDPADGITAGQIDFDAVVAHEIGHALGFISANGGSSNTVLAMWDIFRFRPAAAGVANFDSAPRVLTKGGVQVMFGNFTGTFASQEIGLSTGGPSPPAGDTDDGRQSSHWKADELVQGRPYIGIMDPTISRGLRRTITENDIRAADLLGYSVVFDPARPANDNFASSLPLAGGAGTVTGTSFWATREPGELSTQGGLQAGSLGDKSVWYSWTAPLTGTATFTTAGSSFDTTLGVYTGDGVSTVTRACPACENDDAADGANTSQVQFDATAGAVYRVAVDGWNGEHGTVQLNWSLAAAPTPMPGTLQFGASAYSVGEDGVSAAVTVTRTGGSDGAVSVSYATSNGTATAGPDYAAASGTLSFADGETSKSFSVPVNDDSLHEPGETVSLSLSAPGGGAALGPQSTATLTIIDDDTPLLRFSQPSFPAAESGHFVTVNVTRDGDPSVAVGVDFATSDGTASERRDYTAAFGTLSFAAGETSKSFDVLLTEDAYPEADETINLTLSNPTGGALLGAPESATLVIAADDNPPPPTNPIDNSSDFVRQHYHDFLNREPDVPGLAFWTQQIEQCGANASCREGQRINVSGAFFLSIEFQETGYLVERVYKASFGDRVEASTGLVVPIIRLNEFLADTRRIGEGVIVGQGAWRQQIEANKQAFALEFVQRPRFINSYPLTLTPAQFVANLNTNAGNVLTDAEKTALVEELTANNTDAGRASVLMKIAENGELNRREKNRAFVLMQYYGYLRRNPDDAPERDRNFAGWNFWLTKLNNSGGDFYAAQMVKAFLDSSEYRQRFGQ